MRSMIAVTIIWMLSHCCDAEDWPAFRGRRGDGISNETLVPMHWSVNQNIKWKAKLPQPGNGSPIVSNGHVFLACAEDADGMGRSLLCFDRENGKQIWARTIDYGREMPTHKTNPYCGSTPVSNGKLVVVWHSSAGLHCYDFDGKRVWSRDLGEFTHMWGYGSSPILHDDSILLNCGPGKRTFLTAINLKTGTTLWEQDEPFDGTGDRNEDDKYMGSWCTPIIANVGDRSQVICAMATRIKAHDATTGKLAWTFDGVRGPKGDLAYSSPLISGGRCVYVAGCNGPAMAFKLGGTGNITSTNRMWRNETNPQNIGTGIFIGDHVYRSNAGRPSVVDCINATTGEVTWKGPAGGSSWSSIISANDHLFLTDQDGTTTIFKPNPEAFELVAQNRLDEPTNSTMAISDGEIFIRTFDHLYCIASD